MTFVVVFIALLIERFFDWSHLRRWHWFTVYERKVAAKLPNATSYLLLAATIVPILLVGLILQLVLTNFLFGFAELLFQLFVFIYCLGPQNLWADTFASINALKEGDDKGAEKVKNSFGITDGSYNKSIRRHFLNHIFIEANRRVFAIVVWYVILGPVGAILYRIISLAAAESSKQEMVTALTPSARTTEAILDWLPIRLFTLILALGGHFAQVLSCWRKKVPMSLETNQILLTECGAAALGNGHNGGDADNGSVEKNAISLLDRSFIITLVIIAIFALVF